MMWNQQPQQNMGLMGGPDAAPVATPTAPQQPAQSPWARNPFALQASPILAASTKEYGGA